MTTLVSLFDFDDSCSIVSVLDNYYRNYGTLGMANSISRAERLLRRRRTMRSRDLVAAGLSRSMISRRVAAGALVRVARGLYTVPNYLGGENSALVEVAERAPKVVFCLLTALRLHELTTQLPRDVWIAIGNKEHPPRLAYPPLRTVRFGPASLNAGVETRQIDGTTIRVTNPAKTVADCFKFRNKVGLDVALEALRDARRDKRVTFDELFHFARVNRVENVMRPYLESLAAM